MLVNAPPVPSCAMQYGTRCNSCDSSRFEFLFNATAFEGGAYRYSLYRCLNCDLVFTAPVPSPAKLAEVYTRKYYGSETSKFTGLIELWTKMSARKRARSIIKDHGVPNKKLRILDIGCGRGVLLKAFQELGHDVVGVERAGSPFVNTPGVLCGNLPELNLESDSFDIIILWHVLEHVENPGLLLQEAASLINNSGSLIVSVPNFSGFQANYFKHAWFHLDLPRHLYHFSEKSLDNILFDKGFYPVKKTTFSFDQNIYGFLQSTLNIIPGFKNNHLYEVLKRGFSSTFCFWIIFYIPLLSIVSVGALFELLTSMIQHRGASLTVRAVVKKND